jgi:hypothetical protein
MTLSSSQTHPTHQESPIKMACLGSAQAFSERIDNQILNTLISLRTLRPENQVLDMPEGE